MKKKNYRLIWFICWFYFQIVLGNLWPHCFCLDSNSSRVNVTRPWTLWLSYFMDHKWKLNDTSVRKCCQLKIKSQLDAQWKNQLLSPHCVSCSFQPARQLQLPSIIIPQFKSAWMSSAASVLVCNVAEACRRPRRYSATLTLSEVLRLAPGSASQSARPAHRQGALMLQ